MSGCYFHVIKCKQWNESICCPLCSGRMIMTQNNHMRQKIIKRPVLMEIKATSWKLSVRVWTKIHALTYRLLLDLVILDRIMSCWCSTHSGGNCSPLWPCDWCVQPVRCRYLWRRRHSWRWAYDPRWRTAAARSCPPPSQHCLLLASRTRCHL